MRKRGLALIALAAMGMAALVASAPAANVSYPATYIGTAATGGTVEFDVSPDGTEVTRFALKGVPVPPCGTITGQTPRRVAIVNDSFSNTLGLLHFSGFFPAIQQAQGALSYHRKDGSCDSQEVLWTASTSVPPPAGSAPPPPPPPPDLTPPDTKIKAGPSGTVRRREATLRFTSTDPGATFLCKLDRKSWRACESPWKYLGLKNGRHVFKVKAKDAAGNVDPRPAKRIWRVELS
jgi:hypothetical protein